LLDISEIFRAEAYKYAQHMWKFSWEAGLPGTQQVIVP